MTPDTAAQLETKPYPPDDYLCGLFCNFPSLSGCEWTQPQLWLDPNI